MHKVHKIKKTVNKFIITIASVAVVISAGFGPSWAKAADPDLIFKEAQFSATGGKVVKGYINQTNTGFRVVVDPEADLTQMSVDKNLSIILINGEVLDSNVMIGDDGNLVVFEYPAIPASANPLKEVFQEGINEIKITLNFIENDVIPPQPDPQGSLEEGQSVNPISEARDDDTISTEYFAVLLVADFISPSATILSPVNGKTYKDQVTLSYLLGEKNLITRVYLDDKLTQFTNKDILKDLTQGGHILALEVTDLAGNQSRIISNFTIDKSVTFEASCFPEDGTVFTQGDTFEVKGTADSFARIIIEIAGKRFEGSADSNGAWSILVDTTDLPVGGWEVYVTAIDQFGNESTRTLITNIKVEGKEIKLAYNTNAAPTIEADVTAPKISEVQLQQLQQDKEEVALPIQIRATSDEKETGTNWSAWIILLAIIVLASGLSTLGYYGYEWFYGGQEGVVVREHKTIKSISRESHDDEVEKITDARNQTDKTSEDDERPPTLRW
ncbi:hypothetical protein COT77_01135 [Candidatus Berkelbacteria bacterium CG10_big_fil_rev_8_21_14_0_10_41_12]|uniref:Bacterial Ig-like domain-containing protein n=1 Tax=Candidatus Berkelbacteria bacterium CG10_big_fil_rev_8_21_14_0_10_41_12 TaxID=1974513 RepID=A0A2M6WXK8_9BACT|nr:MAG: hypothetical protein COT77_01135 [Candidatus Berkelbacteria bacterium CG10_big_fil_rev_8_21_14_0_10_41_12]